MDVAWIKTSFITRMRLYREFSGGKIGKNGDKSLPINYRPVSLLPAFAILEKLMYERVISFVNKYSLLSNCQYGFRAKQSCEDMKMLCLTCLIIFLKALMTMLM